MKLPNGHRAELGEKLDECVLNEDHPRGRHKARVFKSVLGITVGSSYLLRQAIMEAAIDCDEVMETGDHGFGMTYRLLFRLAVGGRSAQVLTGWIVERGTDFPRLTTCYILPTE